MLATQAERGKKFWDNWYQAASSENVEWICDIDDVMKSIPVNCLEKFNHVLEIGCGESSLIERMYDEYEAHGTDFVALDVSQVAINDLTNRCALKSRDRITAIVGDATCLPKEYCPDGKFDLVLDKGTSDTFQFRAKNSESKQLLVQLFKEVYRTLSASGVYLIVTPKRRIRYLNSAVKWAKITRIPILSCNNMNVIRRSRGIGPEADEVSQVSEERHPWLHVCYKEQLPSEMMKRQSRYPPRSIRKKDICFSFYNGKPCPRGGSCTFRHTMPDGDDGYLTSPLPEP